MLPATIVNSLGALAIQEVGRPLVGALSSWCLSSQNSSVTLHNVTSHSIAGTKQLALALIPRTALEYLPLQILDYEQSRRRTHARDKLIKDMIQTKDEIMDICWEIRREIWRFQRPWFQQPCMGWGNKLEVSTLLKRLESAKGRMTELELKDKQLPIGDVKKPREEKCNLELPTNCGACDISKTESDGSAETTDVQYPSPEAWEQPPSMPKLTTKAFEESPNLPKKTLPPIPSSSRAVVVVNVGPQRNATLDEVLLDFSS